MRRSNLGKTLSVALCVSLAAGPVARPASGQTTAAAKLAEAKASYEEGEFAAATAALHALLAGELEPAVRFEASLYLGLAESQSGHEAEAAAAFGEVLKLDPNFRLDPVRFAPKLREAFEAARMESLAGSEDVLPITIVQAEGVLTPAEKPPKAFSSKWWQKWWVIGLGVVAVGGAAVALTASAGGPGQPVFVGDIEILDAQCPPIPGTTTPSYPEGDLRVRVSFKDGTAPYTLTFLANNVVQGTPSEVRQSPVTFTYQNLRVTGVGSTTPYTLRVTLQDANKVSAAAPAQTSISIRVNCGSR
jgi:hypothetical protein